MAVVYNLGSLNLDQIYKVPHHVASGETLSAVDFRVGAGGKGCNQSIACALAGAKVCHVGCIGNDGMMLKELLEIIIDSQRGEGVTHAGAPFRIFHRTSRSCA